MKPLNLIEFNYTDVSDIPEARAYLLFVIPHGFKFIWLSDR